MKIFCDNCISTRTVQMIRIYDPKVLHLQEHFPDPGVADTAWLSEVGKQGWALVTADSRILVRAHEIQALGAARIVSFFLFKNYTKQTFLPAASFLIRIWDDLRETAESSAPGTVYDVQQNGKIVVSRPGKKR